MTPGATCYCGDACIELGDCCFDALEHCPIEPPVIVAPPTNTCVRDNVMARRWTVAVIATVRVR
jgi:hypothetical protein